MMRVPMQVLRKCSRVGRVLNGSYEPRSPQVALARKLSLCAERRYCRFAYDPGTVWACTSTAGDIEGVNSAISSAWIMSRISNGGNTR